MSQYLLSTYVVEGAVPGAPSTPEEMQAFMGRVIALEAEMDAGGAFVFGGALQGPEAARVLTPGDAGAHSDGPFAESTAYTAGFYVIDADGLDAALAWGEKVATATNHPIEVRPFFATGRVVDQMKNVPGA
jgi:hypothetical protein